MKDPEQRMKSADELLAALSSAGKNDSAESRRSLIAARAPQASEPRPPVSGGSDENAQKLRQGMGRGLQPAGVVPGGVKTTTVLALASVLVVAVCVLSPVGGNLQRSMQKLSAGLSRYSADQEFKAGTDHWNEAEAKYLDVLKNTADSDQDTRGQIYARLGKIYLQRSKYAAAEKNFGDALACLEPHADSNQDDYLDARCGLAEAFHKMDNYSKADENYVEAANFATDKGDLARLGDIYEASAQNEEDHGIGGKALRYYDEAVDAYTKLENKPADKIASALLASAKLCQQNGGPAEAHDRAQRASEAADNIVAADVRTSIQLQAKAILDGGKFADASTVPTATAPPTVPVIPTLSIPVAVPIASPSAL
ncbi:MAG: tetratricopeptide repeat protein, partial [Terriglobales bacterium]